MWPRTTAFARSTNALFRPTWRRALYVLRPLVPRPPIALAACLVSIAALVWEKKMEGCWDSAFPVPRTIWALALLVVPTWGLLMFLAYICGRACRGRYHRPDAGYEMLRRDLECDEASPEIAQRNKTPHRSSIQARCGAREPGSKAGGVRERR
ncbi:hypothetical protein B0H15DRAFT_855203 [Mycena belliarum]|uniref:Transmembrane protein n=1 Tax=Mycena belliarum TaxID=1033014 RepID=A0AAD6U123_9AGAR|nr:hypothetical protein B0H15DRAFT_855203 [Mycena belliae]